MNELKVNNFCFMSYIRNFVEIFHKYPYKNHIIEK